MEEEKRSRNPYVRSNITITEVNINQDDSSDKEEKTVASLVEEPFDYIFEPDHYAPTDSAQFSLSQEEKYHSGIKLFSRAAKMVGEKDGILEYEYKSVCDIKDSTDQKEQDNYFNDFDYKNHHLNAIIRGISLSKYPGSNFGFELTRYRSESEDYFYVSKIDADTPAEFCLQLGDILIELDDMNPTIQFKSIDELNEFLNEKDDIHLMVIHETKYFRLKAENEDLLKSYCINCEDMVIVSWNQQYESNVAR